MSRLTKLVVLIASGLIVGYVALHPVMGRGADNQATYRSLGVFSEVLQHIQQDYVEEPNLRVVAAGALRGLLESLDPYSSYMSPAEYADYKKKTQSNLKGQAGAALSKRFGYVVVVSVLPGSPAEKAGLRYGDILESIAGFTTREMSVGQAYNLLSGNPGSTVKTSVVRRARTEPTELELTLAAVEQPGVTAEIIPASAAGRSENDVAVLRVLSLASGKANEIRDKAVQLERQGLRKLVLDLRGCALGENSEAVAVAHLFLSSGLVATLRGQSIGSQEFKADPSAVVWRHAVSVLISGSTAGAAEIVAAAIAGNKRGPVVGETSFGAASEQKLIALEDGAALVLTYAKYYTAQGDSILDEGVTPTAEVRSAADDSGESSEAAGRASTRDDPVVKRAIELLRSDGKGRAAACSRQPAGLAARPTPRSDASRHLPA